MNFEVIELNDPNWNKLVKSCKAYDFHHTSCFHMIELQEKQKAILFTISGHEALICLPLIIRPIEGSSLYDATSVYGYSGPIITMDVDDLSEEYITYFQKKFKQFCNEQNIISVFSRLHPLINQSELFNEFGELVDLNKTVSIDLTIPVDEQRRAFRKSLKSELNQLRRFGYTVEETIDKHEIDSFINIYHSTMDKLGASDNYYFGKEYFHSFLSNHDFKTKLLVAKFDGEIVAGAIFTIVGNILQYHLAGTNQEFAHKAPMKLILDEARLLGTSLGLKHLHLGGGVGGEDTDSLFRFKAAFSKNFYQFSVWKMIVDKEKYNELVEKKGLTNSDSNFFPLYRLTS
ncbi:GNAT family N-acetyltransferase [Aequorivita flava]|uniref:GNAT family N-acetyltransferase n=1 Tax=Aequorivita flava TaxID=3114371 RepID=A0AB35YT97_9FLAO